MTTTRSSRRPTQTPPPTEDLDDPTIPEVGMPGFLPEQTPADPLDPTATVTTPTAGLAGDDGSEVDELRPTTSTTAATPSSPTSTDHLPGLQDITRTLVGLASLLVRSIRARRRLLPEGVWLATEDDQAAIGDPLARIAARHAPISGKGSDDVVDGLAAGVGAVGYAMAGMQAEADAAYASHPNGEAEAGA